MALKKSDLYRSLWQSCDELRGGMDASQYKDYILTLLFVKYVTDKAKTDRDSLIDVPDGGSFDDLITFRGDKEIGDKINKAIAKLADANDLRNVIDLADFNDEEKLGRGKEMQDRLSKLVAIFEDLDFSGSRAEGDDLLGDAYEYLMQHFATESGKSKGQFYTPAEVSRVLAKVIGIGPDTRQDQTVYDPTSGSGSLLLKVVDEAPRGITIYGQEKDNATWALAKMNMILHGHADADIVKGDTITSPHFVTDGSELATFDFAVSNPPFSVKSWNSGLELEYGRFEFGRPPEKNGDYAFLLHVLKSLNSTGKAAVILPHGVLFRGHSEAAIRRELVKRGYIKGIIGLPPNLFYGTGIPACIVILDKEDVAGREGVFMIDASREFKKDGAKNRLRSRDIHKIVDVFTRQLEVERYSRMVPVEEIASDANDYNLNIPRYVDSSEPEDLQDLHAHLHGGIPNRDLDALSAFWDAFPSLRAPLFAGNRPGYSDLAVDVADVQQTILDSDEFKQFADQVAAEIDTWFAAHRPALEAIDADTRPNELIAALGDDLLARFRDFPLIDEYAVYEQLLSYWHETMHDDVFLVMHEGWQAASKPRAARVIKLDSNKKPKYEDCDIQLGTGAKAERYVTDLIPPDLVIARYLAEQKTSVDELVAQAGAAEGALEEFLEEHAVEDGLLWDAVDNDKVTDKSARAALKDAKASSDDEAIEALEQVIALIKADKAAKKAAKEAQAELDRAALRQYGELSEEDVRELVLDAKWHSAMSSRAASEAQALGLGFLERIKVLGSRYRETVDEVDAELRELDLKVRGHLAAMGLS
jgi:type I restriction enzyme M protein